MKTTIFNYNGNNITFQLGNGDVMVNATEMTNHIHVEVRKGNELLDPTNYI